MRNRLRLSAFIAVVVVIGLPTRLAPQYMPAFMVQYGGDLLWALMIFLLFGLLFPSAQTRRLVLLAIVVTWGIEFSELYQADWVNDIRSTHLGGLILGFTFTWSDLLCYTCGIGAGVLLDRFLISKRRSASDESQDDSPCIDRGQKPVFPPH